MSRILQAKAADPEAFAALVATWRATGCELALSRSHLFELRRHRDAAVREERYQLLEILVPGRFDMLGDKHPSLNSVMNREILISLAHLIGRDDLLTQVDRYWPGFPLTIPDRTEIEVLRQIENPLLGSVLDLFYSALSGDARANARPKKTRYERSRLSAIPTEKPSAELVEKLLVEVETQARSSPFWQEAISILSNEDMAQAYEEAMASLRKTLSRATQVGMRKAYVEAYAGPRTKPKEYTDTVIQHSTFRTGVEEVLRSIGHLSDPKLIEYGVNFTSTASCPGTWLRDSVEIELRKSKPEPKPNDWFDLDHLTHLPYVDLYLGDAELVNNTTKVLRRDETLPPTLRGIHLPIAVDGSIEGLRRIITARAETIAGR